ncbi:MAG TPA: hypothetical protein VGG77_01400 [Roseiarcus sp.]
MTFRIKALSTTVLFIAFSVSAQAAPAAVSSVFATGGPVGGTEPDSVTIGGGSVWIEYGNGTDSTGAGGSSTIVQYSYGGAVQHTYTISGLVDGLKLNPVTGMVWALQNNDANATLSIINPTTQTVSPALSYGPPYMYTTPGPLARGYDDVAFLNGKVYLSYTNPVNPTDPVLQSLNNGDTPSGTLTTTSILTAQQTGVTSAANEPDIDAVVAREARNRFATARPDRASDRLWPRQRTRWRREPRSAEPRALERQSRIRFRPAERIRASRELRQHASQAAARVHGSPADLWRRRRAGARAPDPHGGQER